MSVSMEELLQSEVLPEIDHNIRMIKQILDNSADLVKREFIFHQGSGIAGVIFYTDGLVNSQQIHQNLLVPLMMFNNKLPEQESIYLEDEGMAEFVCKHVLTSTSIHLVTTFCEATKGLLSGDTLLFLDRSDKAFVMSTRGWDARSVDEPQSETVVRGPRDGFTENIRTNTALVRRRIRDPHLRVDSLQVGKRSETDINIMYIEGIVKQGLVDEVRQRLKRIKIDAVLESGYIEELIKDAPLSPFTTVQNTERPDKVAASLLEGRVAILIDNTPFALIVPTYFWQFLQASDDYYSSPYVGSFFRMIRLLALLISLLLPSLYVMLVSFHQEMIPTPLAITIAAGRETVPFPALLETLIMEIAFELMREAGLRMPRPVGQAVSIVGSLVIGQAAVQAGIISPIMVIIVAITGISSFALPNYATSLAIRLLRFALLLASGIMGILGFAAVITFIMVHALSLRSFGESYLAPVSPFQPSDQKDIIIRYPWWKMNKRPTLADGDRKRQADDLMPHPPKKGTGEQP